MNIDKILTLILFVCILLTQPHYTQAQEKRTLVIAEYEDVIIFANELSIKHGIDKDVIMDAFRNTYFDYSVIELMDKPLEHRPWSHYKNLLITDIRIRDGKNYMKKYSYILRKVRNEYDVPENIITAIIGIESTYGKIPLKRPSIQSVATLAFEYPRREKYFKAELESIFLLAKKEKSNPLNYYGSYAGAIGIPQFMPSNVIAYGKDGDGDGKVDLTNNHADAIASIANFLTKHGWKKDKSTLAIVSLSKNIEDKYFSTNPCKNSNKKTVEEWKRLGVKFNKTYDKNEEGMLIKLDNEDNPLYTIFFENSCPLFKFNASLNYTTAIVVLSEELE